MSPRTRPIWSRSRSSRCRRSSRASDPPGEFDDRPRHRGRSSCATASATSTPRSPRAHAVIELDLAIGRHSGVPLETRGAIGRYDAARDVLELHGAAKVPHRNSETLVPHARAQPGALHLHEEPRRRRLRHPRRALSGGRAGAASPRCGFGRPVKWIEDRREHLICANHARQQRHRVRASRSTRTGASSASTTRFFHDQGAYVRTHGANVPNRTMSMLTGAYRVRRLPGARPFPAHQQDAGRDLSRARPLREHASCASALMDAVAAQARHRPHRGAPAQSHPGVARCPTPSHSTSRASRSCRSIPATIAALLDKALAAFRLERGRRPHAKRAPRRRRSGRRRASRSSSRRAGAGRATARKISVDTSGAVEVVTGGASVGQGFETVMAQICAEALGVDYRRVRVVHGQTDRIDHGIGAHAARATVLTGGAVHVTAVKLRAQGARLCGRSCCRRRPRELDIVDGIGAARAGRLARPARRSRSAISRAASRPGSKLLRGPRSRPHRRRLVLHRRTRCFRYGAHLAVVRIDPRHRPRHRRAPHGRL